MGSSFERAAGVLCLQVCDPKISAELFGGRRCCGRNGVGAGFAGAEHTAEACHISGPTRDA